MAKHITEVWLPGEGNSHNHCYRVGINGVTKIDISEGQGETWLVVKQGDIERYINGRQVTEVVWATEEGSHDQP